MLGGTKIDTSGAATLQPLLASLPWIGAGLAQVSGFVTILAKGDCDASVTAWHGADVSQFYAQNSTTLRVHGQVTGPIDTLAGPTTVQASGDVNAQITGEAVAVQTYGSLAGIVMSNDGAVAVSASGDVTAEIDSAKEADVQAWGSVTGDVTAGGYASVMSFGDHTGDVTAGGDANVQTFGNESGAIIAGAGFTAADPLSYTATVVAQGTSGSDITSSHDIVLSANGPITGTMAATRGGAAVLGGSTVNLSSVTAGADVSVQGVGSVTLPNVTAMSGSVNVWGAQDVTVTASANTQANITAGGAAVANLTLTVAAPLDQVNIISQGSLMATVHADQATVNVTSGAGATLAIGGTITTTTGSTGGNPATTVVGPGPNAVNAQALGDINGSVSAVSQVNLVAWGNVNGVTATTSGAAGQLNVQAGGNLSGTFNAGNTLNAASFMSLSGSYLSGTAANDLDGSASVAGKAGVNAYVVAGSDGSIDSAGAATGSLLTGRDASVVATGADSVHVGAGRDANVAALGGGVSNTVTAGRDASVLATGDVAGAVTAANNASVVTQGNLTAPVEASGGDASVVALGTQQATVDAGHDASVMAGQTVATVDAGHDASVVSLGSVTATVTAGHDASLSTPASSTTTVTGGHNASVFAGGDVLGKVQATAGDAGVTSGGAVSDTVTAGNDAAVYALGAIAGNVTAGRDASVTSWSNVTSAIQAGRDAAVAAQRQLPGDVSAGRDATLLVGGDHSGTTTAGGSATIDVGGSQTGAVAAGLDATVVSKGAFNATVTAGRDADATGFTLATGTVTAGQDASLASWGDVLASQVSGGQNATAWSGGNLDVVITATSGDAAADAAGWGRVHMAAGHDAEASAFDNLTAVVAAGNDATLSSQGGATLNVVAAQNISIFTNGALQGSATATAGNLDATSLDNLQGTYTAGGNVTLMAVGVVSPVHIAAGANAQFVAWGGAAGLGEAGALSAFAFVYGSLGGTVQSSAGTADVFVAGDAQASVIAATDASLVGLGSVAANVTAGRDAYTFAAGALAGNITAQRDATVVGLANVGASAANPLVVKTAYDATLSAIGDLSAQVTAGHDITAVTYGNLAADFNATHDVTLAWARGDVTGTIAAANNVADVAAYGAINAAISAGAGTSAGTVKLVEAYGPIAGTITAGASIGQVQSHGAITATFSAPTLNTPDPYDHNVLTDYPATPAVSLASIWAGLAGDFRDLSAMSAGVAADMLGQLAALAASRAAAFAAFQPTLGDAGLAAADLRNALVQLQAAFSQTADQVAQSVVGAQIAQRDGWSQMQVAAVFSLAGFQDQLHQMRLAMGNSVADFSERAQEMATLGAVAKSAAQDDKAEAIAKWNNERDVLRPAQFDERAKGLIFDRIHTALTILSLLDKTGAVDIIEALLYAYEGRWKEAFIQGTLGFLLGDIASLRKLGSKAGDVFGTINGARRFGRGLGDAGATFGQTGMRFFNKVQDVGSSTLRAALMRCPDAASCFVAGTLVWLDEDQDDFVGTLDVFPPSVAANADSSDDSWLGTLVFVGIGVAAWQGVNRAQRRKQAAVDAAFGELSDDRDGPAPPRRRLRTNTPRPSLRLDKSGAGAQRAPCSSALLDAATAPLVDSEPWIIALARQRAHDGAILDAQRSNCHPNPVESMPMSTAMHSANQCSRDRGHGRAVGLAVLLIFLSLAGFWQFRTRGAHVTTPNAPVTSLRFSRSPAAEATISARAIPIEEVRIGNRVRAKNPAPEKRGGLLLPPVDEATSIAIRIAVPSENGQTVLAELLRPNDWIEALDAEVGSAIDLDMPEFGIEGPVLVLSIDSCPTIKPGRGRIVTGTFHHQSDSVVDLHVDGVTDPIGVTSNHRFWSQNRRSFIPAGELRQGEQLLAIAGPRRVASVVPRAGMFDVYNLEVEFEHVYHVGDDGILVHNACAWKIYEVFINSLYGGQLALGKRRFISSLGKGVADNIAGAGADAIAIEAKFIRQWSRSIYNPTSPFSRGLANFLGSAGIAAGVQNKLLLQAQRYSTAFREVIYHTNSKAFANYLRKQFANLPNIKVVVTPGP